MPLGKNDNPEKLQSDSDSDKAVNEMIDSGAGAPESMRPAAEDLPEGDPVKDNIKAAMLANDAQSEAKFKAKVVDDSSTGAEETPSGFALKAVIGIADDVKRGEEYARIKSAKRHGWVPASDADLKAKK